jgi:hypothetical protein
LTEFELADVGVVTFSLSATLAAELMSETSESDVPAEHPTVSNKKHKVMGIQIPDRFIFLF